MNLEQIKAAKAIIKKRTERARQLARGGEPEELYTPEQTIETAKSCESINEFRVSYPAAYKAARTHGTMIKIKEILPARIKRKHSRLKKWNDEKAMEEAKKYTAKTKFLKGAVGAYAYLDRNGLIEEACKHMTKNTRWNDESAMEEALKYQNLRDFLIKSSGAYHYCRRNMLLDEACLHMTSAHKKHWTKLRILTEAAKYEYFVDFKENSKEAYNAANRLHLITELKSKLRR